VTPKRALLLVTKWSVEQGQSHPEDLAALLNTNGEGLEVSSACLEDLLFAMDEQTVDVVDTANDRPLTEYDVVYFRFWGDPSGQGPALAAAQFCKTRGIPFIDSEALRTGSFNKITQYMNLHQAGVAFPKTLIAPADKLMEHYARYGFTFPLILKNASGTRGQDNYLVQDEAEMRRILTENGHLRFVLQTFLPNDGDYRLVVMGGEVVLAIRRTASGETHLNNTSQGGSAELVPVDTLPKDVCAAAVRASQHFGRQVAGVDMVQSTADGRWYCFEVNRAPQIEHASFEHEKAKALSAYLKTIAK
jgi:ribosomal protein S6--L-glutamate ligase